jgi:hypothetical protein
MNGNDELSAMGKVLELMEPLDSDARKRVLGWVSQKLGVELQRPKPGREVPLSQMDSSNDLDLSTDTIATILGAESGADLIIAAAAQLHFVQGKPRFTRKELTAEMRTAPGHFKDAFINNLSKYLTGLTKADRLRLVAADTFALSSKERPDLQAKISSAA